MKKTLIFILLILLATCSVNQSAPEWYSQPDIDPLYYTAWVKVSKKEPAYQELAFRRALQDIAMQINTQIQSRIASSEWVVNGVLGGEYRQSLIAISDAKIRDLQLAQSQETARDYYALYRLNKAQYQAQRELECKRALASAYEMMQGFDAVQGDFTLAANLLTSALESIMDYLDMDLSYDSPTGRWNLYTELFSRFNALPAALELNFKPLNGKLMGRLATAQYTSGYALYRGEPCPNLPLCATLEGQGGVYDSDLFTDAKGEFVVEIKKLTPSDNLQRIGVMLNKQPLAERISQPALRGLWQNLVFARSWQSFLVERPKVYLDYSFIAAYQSGLSERITHQLASWQLDSCSRLEEAQYLLQIRIFAKAGEHLPYLNYYSSFGDIHLTLLDAKSGAIVNYLEHLGLKSGGKSREAAERQVEPDAISEILSGLLYRLLYDTLL